MIFHTHTERLGIVVDLEVYVGVWMVLLYYLVSDRTKRGNEDEEWMVQR